MSRVSEIRRAIVSVVSAFASGAPAAADDTEVFRSTPPPGMRANVLFVIDDSISMGAAVLTQPVYDAAVAYPSQGCDVTRVYWKAGTGAPPGCATADWLNASAMQCDKATRAFAVSGRFWDDHMAQYDPSASGTWRNLASDQKDRVVECHDDGGEQVSWDSREQATLYSGNYMNWYYGPGLLRSRLDVVQAVVDDLLETLDGVNVGLMDFNSFAGGAGRQRWRQRLGADRRHRDEPLGDAERCRGADTECRHAARRDAL